MNLVADEKEPKPKNKRHSFLIAIAVALCLFIAVDICLIIFIVGRSQSAEPRVMVLRNTSDDMVLLGTTKQDLEQTMDLSEKWMISAFKGDAEAGREKIDDMGQLIMSERIVKVSSGTSCLLLESGPTMCKVQITEGLRKGQNYWVYREFVGYPEAEEYTLGEEYTFGGVFASICVRYLITGFICCVGIYYLRIKSILLQIVCFILGYIVLNLIWVRIVSHFMF